MTTLTMKFKRHLTALICSSMLIQAGSPAFAANHPNSSIEKINIINLVANVDWDYDGVAPIQAGQASESVTPAVLDKSKITEILREMARSVYLMTEGRHRVGKVYVYKNNRFGENVDIRIVNQDGRSYGHAAKWGHSSGTTVNFLSMSNRAENLKDYSKVIAHELGHYTYGLYDEYREAGRALDTANPSSPSDVDTPKNTIMHLHTRYTRLSLADDYAGPASQNQTAQARMHATDRVNMRGGSAWETLVRDPANDPNEQTKRSRTLFDAFKGFKPPSQISDLTKYAKVFCNPNFYIAACGNPAPGTSINEQVVPESDRITNLSLYDTGILGVSGGRNGADAADGDVGTAFENFKVVFADSPLPIIGNSSAPSRSAESRQMLMLDTSLETNNIEFAVEIATGIVANAGATDKIGLMLTGTANPLVELTTTNAAGKATLNAALDRLKANPPTKLASLSFTTDYNNALIKLKGDRTEGDAIGVNLVTGRNRTVDAALIERSRTERIPVSVSMLTTWYPESTPVILSRPQAGTAIPVGQLASMSGGNTLAARNVQAVIAQAAKAAKEDMGENEAEIVDSSFHPTSAGSQTTDFVVHELDGDTIHVNWYFDVADANKLSFKLISPKGQVITKQSADADLAHGHALIEIDNTIEANRGKWKAVVSSTAATKSEIELSVLVESEVDVQTNLLGLDRGQAPVLEVNVGGKNPIAKADVKVQIYNAINGDLVLDNLKPLDDGKGLDEKANDGNYVLSLDKLLPAGNYYAHVMVASTDKSTFENRSLNFISADPSNPNTVIDGGTDARLVGAGMTRSLDIQFSLAPTTMGAIAGSNPSSGTTTTTVPTTTSSLTLTADISSGGGGCTVNKNGDDSGLLLLLGLAGLLALARRRTNSGT